MPSAVSSAGIYACTSICRMVTNAAITVIYAGRRTLSGITLRSAEMAMLEPISTNVAARPMPMPFVATVVTASVGQVPSTRRSEGFSLSRPLVTMRSRSFIPARLLPVCSVRSARPRQVPHRRRRRALPPQWRRWKKWLRQRLCLSGRRSLRSFRQIAS